MANIDSVRAVINRHFQHVIDLGDGIVRGERLHDDKPYAVAYIDLSDSVVERSHDLTKFQEGLLGADFFSPDSALRWNSYLYFLAGPKSTASSEFRAAKSQIESDRHFARKFVLDEADLAMRLGEQPKESGLGPVRATDAGATWSELLRTASLAMLLEQRPRTTTLDLIASGEAFKAEPALPPPSMAVQRDALASGLLRKLTVETFRRVNRGKTFMFGDVNLIVGANGTGKTSLLEAIEVLYCGRVRRDPEAAFQNIVGEVENERGGLETVKATTTTATLKARNTTWYGRTDMQANAISQGFTRFNFLDTDAAFRLSSEDSNEQIKHDLGRLLVGPETSKLWTYLSKLADEVGGRLKSLDDRLPSERRNVELLADEVRRLREAPSEANTLLKAFRSGVAQLNPRWGDPDQGSALAPGERTRLETLSRSIAQVLSAISDTPVTREKIQQRVAHMQGVVGSAKKIQVEHDAAVKQATEAANRTKESLALQTQLEQWAKLVEADVPALAGKLREAEARTGHLRAVLRDQSADSPPDVPAEYAELPIQEGLAIAGLKLKEAQEQDRIAATALSQGMQLGQTLEMLRRDLHDASVTYLERSGEATLCPVCKTPHPANELLAKIEALVRSDSSQVSDSLRRNVQNARERLEQARVAVTQLSALDTFRQASGASAMSTATQLHLGLRHAREELRSLTSDVQSYQTALAQLNLVGLQWSSWQQMRDAVAIPLLPLSADPIDLSAVKLALDGMKERAQTDADTQAKALDSVSELVRQAVDLASNELSVPATNLGPAQVVTSMERRLQQAELAASTVDALAATIPLDADTALEAVQSGVEASLLEYDKALHALQGDELAKTVLKKKDEELQSATQTLTTNSTARTNLARAREVLSTLVTDHSLDKATADAFNAIRGNVSSVFAQIHSPPEYELGNLNEGELIIRRDNKQRHAANQVSSGQRAALALSIFLALNDSAKTAPPVILIDDPVAHIDDLNALSFLDYLREVVVGGRKQVFFATADVRLAALFQRKFEFLGSKRFKRITLPLDEAILA